MRLVFLMGLACWLSLVQGCQPNSKKPSTVEGNDSALAIAPKPTVERPTAPSIQREGVATLRFVEVQSPMGIEHIYDNGATGKLLAVETLGGGCGWIDYDRDGLQDVLLNQGGDPSTSNRSGQPVDALYRNLGGRFVRVDHFAGFHEPHFSQAVAVGDHDNDGFDDIYVSNVFSNTFWHNCGDGTFVQSTSRAGIDSNRWSSTAAWADLDGDGDLDLYVCNYLDYDPTNPKACHDDQGRIAMCNPSQLPPLPDACFINQGDGSFQEKAAELGLVGEGSRALSVAIADFNNDDLPDLYVANDTNDNFLFINLGNGHFEDRAKILGCATDHLGMPQASMGLGVNDFDQNGFLDIYSTHYVDESNTLYANYGDRGFQDITGLAGLHAPTLSYLGFGSVMQDFDHDGSMELFVANGHVVTASHKPRPQMPAQLFHYLHGKKWMEVSQTAGDYFKKRWMGRGVATGDFDNDGDLDLLVLNQNDVACLLKNESQRGHWIKVSFIGVESNRSGIGCRVDVWAGDSKYVQQLCGGTSFASSHQNVLSFGLGDRSDPVRLRIRWPSGIIQQLEGVQVDQHLVVRETRNQAP